MNQYIFTPTGFYPDTQEKETLEKRYEILYHMGFSKRSKEMCIGEEGLHGSRIRKAGVIRGVKADSRVHSAQQLFQLRAQLFLIGGGFKQDQIMAAGIAEQAGQQNGQVFHLTQRPAQLFILNAQGGVALGHTQVFN